MQELVSLRQSTRVAHCLECGKCTAMCPLAVSGDFSARMIPRKDLEEVLEHHAVGVQRCLTCAACEAVCPQNIRFTHLVQRLREMSDAEAPELTCPHGGALQSVMRMMAKGKTQQNRLEWLTDDLRTDPAKGEVFYWVGCTMYYDGFFPDSQVSTLAGSRAAIRLLNKMGLTPVVSPEERCCGHDLLWSGDRAHFEMLARHNIKLVADSGAETLVISCAEGLRTWKIDYEPYFEGKMPRIMHLTEFVAESMESGAQLNFKTNGQQRRVTFQDPCRLGRHLEIYDPPRKVLQALPGVELTEMRRSRRSAVCCAGGPWAYCDHTVKQIQVDRLREARATGAEVMVTSCPKCQIHFRCAMKDPKLGPEIEMPMQDVAELVEQALEGHVEGKEEKE